MFSVRDSQQLFDSGVRADRGAAVIESMLVVLAVFAPLLGSVAVLVWRPAGLNAGRCVAAACGIAFAAAVAVAVVSGTRPDGLVDGAGWLGLRLDRATALLLAAVTSTGAVVASFARRSLDLDSRANRFFMLFAILVTGSALVVVPGGWLTLSIGWVGSSWALVGLLGHRNDLPATQRAQRHTYRALAVGDAALLLAVVLIVAEGGVDPSLNLAALAGELASSTVFGVGVNDLVALLLVVAGASRSALVPFHRWLVSTLAAPTPVSALVHAGFVSGAGLLLIRFGPIVLESFVAVHLAFALAVATTVAGIGAASKRVDVKGKLAWSTVAQMGFMVLQCTVGAFSSAVFHIIGHGMYKATMFLGAGDAISSGLRSTRRASPLPLPSARVRLFSTIGVATAAVGLGLWILPPDVSDGGVALVVVFSWVTAVHGVWGWLGRGAMSGVRAVVGGAVGCVATVFGYLGGLRLVEHFVQPSFGELAADSGVGVSTLLITLAIIAAVAAILSLVRLPAVDTLDTKLSVLFERIAHPGVAGTGWARRQDLSSRSVGVDIAPTSEPTELMSHEVIRSKVRADVARAATIIAPAWPLTSFVAVNPLGGLEQLGFDGATAVARRQLHARTHLSLEEFRRDHQYGLTTLDDLHWAIESQFIDLCSIPPIRFNGRSVSVAEIVRLDMLHGPDVKDEVEPLTALEHVEGTSGSLGAMIDASIFHSAAQFAGHGAGSFQDLWRKDAIQVAGLRRHLDGDAQRWLRGLSDDPAEVIATAFAVTGVDAPAHVDEMRGHLGRLQGWAGYAKWRTDWAHPDEQRRSPALIDLVAARSALEAACLLGHTIGDRSRSVANAAAKVLAARVDAVVEAGFPHADVTARNDIEQVLSHFEPFDRNAAWLRAQERNVEQHLLSKLDRLDPGTPVRPPDAQLVFCIDVRSEGLRRHLEATGPYDTIGFAGFFGVAMSVRRLEWQQAEPRCPVLVKPSVLAIERPIDRAGRPDAVDAMLARDRLRAGATAVHASTKHGLGAPFVMAEAAGWIAGPAAAMRTLFPPRRTAPDRPPTVMELDGSADGGLDLEQRVFTAEAVLKTMGLTKDFAPLVVLCGHASDNVNNPHATALDCGACAGASGQDNARTVVRLLNDVDVRGGLRERTIDIPDTTHFCAALHDTVSDDVRLLDTHDIPPAHNDTLKQLVEALDAAARGQSAQRALHLPGPSGTVRNRGGDWAQIRSEWGLARNNSFIIGPRSMTTGLDLDGRSFLHTYDADQDPDGKVLETIMTAPLVVAHWISSQYYFSTVDPDTFGAGDKLIHNIAANTGVISGEHGDLRVGLPLQSTHIGDRRHHQPVRLLAVIQAPLERIERVIDQNPILTTLVGGSWIRIAGRSHPHERWSIRTPNGTWSAEPRPIDINNTLETS
ncbi:MAG: hypothetical protein ACI9N0_002451 [Ilumatobacter sp.]|jgi:uncharacterized protein YbcC (UPF0753/DUF2309 family)/formate hydrogenlyase subunit 3/multisubunit Na+/H+ antiporter MnhD subunit